MALSQQEVAAGGFRLQVGLLDYTLLKTKQGRFQTRGDLGRYPLWAPWWVKHL